jgi:transcriptional regulator with XRE-family HTH domain
MNAHSLAADFRPKTIRRKSARKRNAAPKSSVPREKLTAVEQSLLRIRRVRRPKHSNPYLHALRDARIRLGLTQREVAKRAGFALGALAWYELGRRSPTSVVFIAWFEALGFTLSEHPSTVPPRTIEAFVAASFDAAEQTRSHDFPLTARSQ